MCVPSRSVSMGYKDPVFVISQIKAFSINAADLGAEEN
jgi:hypothetical protein